MKSPTILNQYLHNDKIKRGSSIHIAINFVLINVII